MARNPARDIACLIIRQAIQQGATAIHIEPEVEKLTVRYQIDGVLHEALAMPRRLHQRLLEQYRSLPHPQSGMDRLRPLSSGRHYVIPYCETDYDLNVTFLLTPLGETIMMKLAAKPDDAARRMNWRQRWRQLGILVEDLYDN